MLFHVAQRDLSLLKDSQAFMLKHLIQILFFFLKKVSLLRIRKAIQVNYKKN